jgi:hypothetical protein
MLDFWIAFITALSFNTTIYNSVEKLFTNPWWNDETVNHTQTIFRKALRGEKPLIFLGLPRWLSEKKGKLHKLDVLLVYRKYLLTKTAHIESSDSGVCQLYVLNEELPSTGFGVTQGKYYVLCVYGCVGACLYTYCPLHHWRTMTSA